MSGLGLLLAVCGLVRWRRLQTTNTKVCLCLVSGVSVSGVSVSGVSGESVSGVSVSMLYLKGFIIQYFLLYKKNIQIIAIIKFIY